MGKPSAEIVLFYCTHQREAVNRFSQAVKGLNRTTILQVALPCSGKLEVFHLTRALESGAEGVALFACPEGDCRYMVGSTRGKGRVAYAGRILEEIGLGKDRVRRFVLRGESERETEEDFSGWVEKIRAWQDIHPEFRITGGGENGGQAHRGRGGERAFIDSES